MAKALNLSIGQEIYYGGDMANVSGFGKITELHPSPRFGDQVTIKMNDGREMTIPTCMIKGEYQGHGGVRFCTIEAYNKWREESLADLQRRYMELVQA